MKSLKNYVRSIPNFPKEGIIFRDVTTVLQDAEGLQLAIKSMEKQLENLEFDYIVSPESRGFIFGVPLAYTLKKGFIPVRKKGKLPCDTIKQTYDLEYGTATLEIHKDAIQKGQKVVIVDDLLATGGTVQAMIKLVEALGGEVVKICSLIELPQLNGRKKLEGYSISSVIEFEGE